jgi:hypothetical protein
LIWVTAVSNAWIAERARARSNSAWDGAPSPMNQRRSPAQRCCQRNSAAANASGPEREGEAGPFSHEDAENSAIEWGFFGVQVDEDGVLRIRRGITRRLR